jgi:serine protease inhibitor
MEIAFSDIADFTGINPAGELYIDEVKHKTYVKVNEEGTEAAAATSVQIDKLGAPAEMLVNRPFLFVIHDKHSKAMLFMGKIADPPSE